MNLGKTLHIKNRNQWRKWLEKNHKSLPEIWLVYYKKHTGKASIPYNDAVEEALCFGWIDSTVKKIDEEKYAQRFTPRKLNSNLSETNKERVRRLIKEGKMTSAGLDKIKHHLEKKSQSIKEHAVKKFSLPDDILKKLKSDAQVWSNFQNFPEHYKQIRIGWIDSARKRPDEFQKRLRYFIKMTAKNKKFGMVK